jgi:squalene-hopene/tetraprenyl-beta-curcumene cyclase
VGAARHLLDKRRQDGSWALYHGGPTDLSTTIEAYVALRVLGVEAADGEMRRSLRVIHRGGGLACARVFTKIWLALFGEYPWEGVPSMPPELVWLPSWAPLNLYDFACWARATVAPLLIVLSRRPRRPLGVTVHELTLPGTEARLGRPGSGPLWWIDQVLKRYDRLPWQPGRDLARRRLVRWIADRQDADGGWGGIQPPWVYSLIALSLEGMALDSPVIRRGLEGLDGFAISDGRGWRLQACQSPVWDTAWAVRALVAAGLDGSHPAVDRAVGYLLDEQITGLGDWKVRCPGWVTECGGWAFEFQNDVYPDVDDTAVVVCALREAGPAARVGQAVRRAERWCRVMNSSDGGWAAFDRDNTSTAVYRLPFADFGALTDPPTEDVTAHVLEMFAALGVGNGDVMVGRGLDFLRRTQLADGSWYGRWGVNHIYGTWCAVSALTALRTGQDMTERATRWLFSKRNPDGGWGETCWSYEDPSFAGVGASTPSQTAWAVISLQLAGLGEHPACGAELDFLRERQRDGTWDEPEYTGTGFPRDFYINYHLYRHLFPTMALSLAERVRAGIAPVYAGTSR